MPLRALKSMSGAQKVLDNEIFIQPCNLHNNYSVIVPPILTQASAESANSEGQPHMVVQTTSEHGTDCLIRMPKT